jgi:hypothetical protein
MCLKLAILFLGGQQIVTDLYSSLEGETKRESDRVREREKTSKTRGDYASYNMGRALRKWANRNKVFKILTVDSIRQ